MDEALLSAGSQQEQALMGDLYSPGVELADGAFFHERFAVGRRPLEPSLDLGLYLGGLLAFM